jgi:putative flippase GtrA
MQQLQRFDFIYKPFRFSLVGVLATACYFIIGFILNVFVLDNPLLVHFISYGTCIPLSYYLQQGFTFKYNGDHKSALFKFILVNIAGLLIGAIIVSFIENLGYHSLWGTGIICVAIPVINYLMFDLWVFKKKKDS